MTARDIFKVMLIELSKVHAPSLLLEDYNYFVNRAITLYINKRYALYDINLQVADDLRVLKSTCVLIPLKALLENLYDAVAEVELPLDYFHLLGCVCVYEAVNPKNCYTLGKTYKYSAKRLMSDSWGSILNDYYSKPLPLRPYYYIHNISTSNNIPTNPFNPDTNSGTDMPGETYKVTKQDGAEGDVINLPRTIIIGNNKQSRISKSIANRYGNASKIRMEIRYGDDSVLKLTKVFVDYLKTPLFVLLTLELLDLIEDTSLVIEFPDYVCQEIINELVNIVMENNSDPRLQTHIPVSLSIAQPTQTIENPKK